MPNIPYWKRVSVGRFQRCVEICHNIITKEVFSVGEQTLDEKNDNKFLIAEK